MPIGTSDGFQYESEMHKALGYGQQVLANDVPITENVSSNTIRDYGIEKLKREFLNAQGVDEVTDGKYDDSPTYRQQTRDMLSNKPTVKSLQGIQSEMEDRLNDPNVNYTYPARPTEDISFKTPEKPADALKSETGTTLAATSDATVQPTIWDKLKQTWPARLAEDMYAAVTLPGDVYQGKVDVNSPEGQKRTFDLAALLTGGSVAKTSAKAPEISYDSLVNMADKLGNMTYKEYSDYLGALKAGNHPEDVAVFKQYMGLKDLKDAPENIIPYRNQDTPKVKTTIFKGPAIRNAANDNKNLQIDDSAAMSQIDWEWAQMAKDSRKPDLKVIKGGPKEDIFTAALKENEQARKAALEAFNKEPTVLDRDLFSWKNTLGAYKQFKNETILSQFHAELKDRGWTLGKSGINKAKGEAELIDPLGHVHWVDF